MDIQLTHGSLFSGIGGAEVAAEMVGWKNLFHCEIADFQRQVLDYWFPESESYKDVTKTDFTKWRGRVDVLTGGFPCQPFSTVGRRKGEEDDRFLWFEMLKAIRECQPTWVVGENVVGLSTMVQPVDETRMEGSADIFGESDDYKTVSRYTLGTILDSLVAEGYSVQTFVIPACAVGAPHRRDRVWIVGHRDGDAELGGGLDANTKGKKSGQREKGSIGEGDGDKGIRAEANRAEGVFHGWSRRLAKLSQPAVHACGCGARDGGRGGRLDGSRPVDSDASGGTTADADSDGLEERDGQGQEGREVAQRLPETPLQAHREAGDGRPSRPAEAAGGDAPDAECDRRAEERNAERDTCQAQPQECREEQPGGTDCPQDWWRSFPSEPAVCRGDDGFPEGLDNLSVSKGRWRKETIKSYGNAWVPQVAAEIFRAINAVEHELRQR